MAPNDNYDSKGKYERFLGRLDELTDQPADRRFRHGRHAAKYVVRNPKNKIWFRRLADILAARDTSYIRRLKLMRTLKLICHATVKPLHECDRDDINAIWAFSHTVCHTPKTKTDFVIDIKFIWRQLFPETDEKGRPDETLTPYPVRHMTGKVDRSRNRTRRDKATPQEIKRLIQAFGSDKRMQTFVATAYEALARPQELLYRRIRDVELFDNYARIEISDHGKEGCGLLQCIDSYPYLIAWLDQHPLRHDPDAFLFCNLDGRRKHGQMKVPTVNKHIRNKLQLIGIDKPITIYSLKRNGVTHRRLRGDSDVTIQHVGRWTSTRQLRTYDQSDPIDTYDAELCRRGLKSQPSSAQSATNCRVCLFCQTSNSATDLACTTCKRPLDREKIEAEIKAREADHRERENDRAEIEDLRTRIAQISQYLGTPRDQNSNRPLTSSKFDRPFPGTANTT